MTPQISIIMGSISDLPKVEKAASFLEELEIPFEMHAFSAHRTPAEVAEYSLACASRGVKVIIAAAGMSAALPGVIAAYTTLPVIGLPIDATLQGTDALLSICQMPPGIPVASVGINASLNAAVLAVRILALSDKEAAEKYAKYHAGMSKKVKDADAQLQQLDKFKFQVKG